MKTTKRLLNAGLFILPFILGTCGFWLMAGESLLDSAFKSVTMYALNFGDTPPNLLTEFARWTAPIASAGAVITLFTALSTRLRNWLRHFKPESTAIYGNDEMASALVEALGKRAVIGGDKPARAANHVLLFDEETNLNFYKENRGKLKGRIYVRSTALPSQTVGDAGTHFFCPEETAARLYWKENCLYPLAKACGFKLNVVFIGFGKLGEELLYYGLQNNIFDRNQKLTYHVFGNANRFLGLHPEISSFEDAVIAYEDSWYAHKALLQSADLIIVTEQSGQTALISDLLFLLPRKPLTVFAANDTAIELLNRDGRLKIVDWQTAAYAPEAILSTKLIALARRINLQYAHRYEGAPLTEAASEAEWEKLDTFTRYSNISSADYHEIRLCMLKAMGHAPGTEFTEAEKETLSELEHIRWMRYHRLQNWSYGEPADGKRKDPAARIHRDLVSYGKLTREEQIKDWETIELLLGIEL